MNTPPEFNPRHDWSIDNGRAAPLIGSGSSCSKLLQRRSTYDVLKDVSLTATVDNTPNLATAELLSGGAFDTLGIAPVLGRALTPADDTVGRPRRPYLRFLLDPALRALPLRPRPDHRTQWSLVTIVGVAPASFNGLDNGTASSFSPIAQQPLVVPRAQNGSVSLLDNPQSWWLQVMIRLRPGVPESQAQTQAQTQLDLAFRPAAQSVVPSAKAMESLHLRLEAGSRGADSLHRTVRPVLLHPPRALRPGPAPRLRQPRQRGWCCTCTWLSHLLERSAFFVPHRRAIPRRRTKSRRECV